MLLAARVAQGVGAAAFGPAALALVTSVFDEGPERERAVGIYSAMGALGFAAGLVVGGVVTQLLGWRLVMFAAVPIVLPVLLLTPVVVAERRNPRARRGLDLPGAATVTLGLAALLYALSGVAENEWASPTTLWFLALGAALLAGFVVIEHRAPEPLVPPPVFRVRPVTVVNAAMVLRSSGETSDYLLTLYLQQVLGRSPIEVGLIYVWSAIAGAVASLVGGRLVDRLGGARPTMLLGMVVQATGLLLMALMLAGGGLAVVIAGKVIQAIGKVVANVAMTIGAMSGLGQDQKGLAAGLLTTSGQLGAAWGLGAAAAVVAVRTGAPGGEGARPEALVAGLRAGLLFGVAFVALALLVVVAGLRGRERRGRRMLPTGAPVRGRSVATGGSPGQAWVRTRGLPTSSRPRWTR